MSIKDKLDYIKETKELIKEGLNNLGEPVGDYDTFRSYPEIIDDLYNNWPRVTASGESVSLDQTMEAPLSIDLKGNTTQASTPTPSTPVNVNVVSGDNEVVVCGKNLLNIQGIVKGRLDSGNIGYVSSVDNLTLNENSFSFTTNASNRGVTTDYIGVESGSYTISSDNLNSTYGLKVACYNSIKTWFQDATFTGNASEKRRIITIPSGTSFIRIYFSLSSAGSITITNPQLEIGNQVSTYTPYQSQSYNVNLGTTELCKISTYQDYIYKNSGKWYLHKEVGKVVLNGSETWEKGSDDGNRYYFYTASLDNQITSTTGISNYFPIGYSSSGSCINLTLSYAHIRLFMLKTLNIDSVATLTQWLTTNNVSLYYGLTTATETEITNTTLINQLEALKGAMSYEGQTNISQVNNDLPFILDVEALEGSGS